MRLICDRVESSTDYFVSLRIPDDVINYIYEHKHLYRELDLSAQTEDKGRAIESSEAGPSNS